MSSKEPTRKRNHQYYPIEPFGLRRLRGTAASTIRFFCFPFSGGQSLSFRQLAQELPESWEVLAIDPPGHGWCRGAPLQSIDAMVDAYVTGLAPWLTEKPYHLYGHSLGGQVALRLTQRLEAQARAGAPVRLPTTLFLSASPLPHRAHEYRHMASSDSDLLRELQAMGSTPDGLMGSAFFIHMLLPVLRADFVALTTFPVDQVEPLRTPIHILYSQEDPFVPSRHMHEWRRYGESVRFEVMQGQHMFVVDDPTPTAQRLQSLVEQAGGHP
jgi:external thioesterase TEII